jgi:citronellol/citronellal dehydrogenase
VALVTGASRGIGRAIAIQLAGLGADIVLAARSTEAAPSRVPGTIDEAARRVEELGRRALALRVDLRFPEQIEGMARRALGEFGRLDILVNNAAYMYRAPFANAPLERWDLVLDVNLRGPVVCTQSLLPHMLERGEGRVLNISSAAAVMLLPEIVSYSTSKAALETLTRGLANELRTCGIAVNALRIETAVATEGAVYLNPQGDYSGWERPESVAECAGWIVSRPVSYSGNVITIVDVREAMERGR